MSIKLFILLIIFQLKHFVADFPLQNEYMLGKFKKKGWILPLACHAGMHSLITFIISLCFVSFSASIGIALFDFVIHFAMDRIKASPDMLGKYSSISKNEFKMGVSKEQMEDNKKFWWALGLDQGVHHITHYIIIAMLL